MLCWTGICLSAVYLMLADSALVCACPVGSSAEGWCSWLWCRLSASGWRFPAAHRNTQQTMSQTACWNTSEPICTPAARPSGAWNTSMQTQLKKYAACQKHGCHLTCPSNHLNKLIIKADVRGTYSNCTSLQTPSCWMRKFPYAKDGRPWWM